MNFVEIKYLLKKLKKHMYGKMKKKENTQIIVEIKYLLKMLKKYVYGKNEEKSKYTNYC